MPTASPLTTIREATPDEIPEVLRHTHAMWGGGKSIEAYIAQTRALLDTPWGRGHYRFVVGLDATGAIATACKRYHLEMTLDGRPPVEAVGFGAVFTPTAWRGHGYARSLIATVMAEEAALGRRLAVLFTDIGPAYYERLGFQSIRCMRAEAAAEPGPIAFEPIGDRPAEAWLRWRRAPDAAIAFAGSADYEAFKLARHRPTLVLYAPGGVACGYAAIHVEPEGLWVDQAGFAPEVSPSVFWRDMRALAAHHGAPNVRGWLPLEAAEAGYAFTPLVTNAPMIAPLAHDPLPDAAQFWANDHF